ncbi:NtaA/DmoA family FMN-dependent monooxygenase [Streptomyces paludis]|uniref:LLM class flavin-dependent oxidoreductase n=1 Tax=Streptomyces paludis TaxID=2282738 RepID=A0A345HVZ3_9ACTN|nr:NtaA/DmoA family FMN-dependent monooxygenase [Streptomyces paludis]AXG80867.1 LLM class flavin-dependent oxidoreductase [Streptomyces paludis]
MTDRRFHLGWFLNYTVDGWDEQWSDGGRDWSGEVFVDIARQLDRAGFDYVLLEDKLMVADAYGGSFEAELRHAQHSPKLDPAPLVPLLAQATEHLGFIVTLSSTFYPPFLLARLVSTLDHLTGGRVGWNIVTSAEDRAAQNFGHDAIPEHDLRYEKADEYVDLVRRLWGSWEPDAVVRDRATRTYIDHTKVHDIDFEGRFYRSRGPLNTVPSPQHFPVLAQAGGSPKGRALGAKYADTVVAPASTVEDMRAYRDDIRRRAAENGRDPDDVKVLFLVAPVLGDTDEHAWQRVEARVNDPLFIERSLVAISDVTDIDFSRFDLDQPLPADLATHGEQGTLRAMLKGGRDRTLRELITGDAGRRKGDLVGSPATVADRLEEIAEAVGGDGFLFHAPNMRISRKYVIEVTDGLVPELRRRGLLRTADTPRTRRHLRDTLREF